MTAALVVALLSPLLLASPSQESTEGGAAEERFVTAFMELAPLEGQSESEASDLLQRMLRYHQAHYTGSYSLSILERAFGDGWVMFSEFTGINQYFAVQNEQAADDGWLALAEEFGKFFGPVEPTLLFTLNGVGCGDGNVIRVLKVTRSPNSKIPLARRFARELAESLSRRHDYLQVRTFSSDIHEPGRIYWCFDYSGGNAGWETERLSLLSDDDYVEMHRDIEGLFFDDETTVRVFLAL